MTQTKVSPGSDRALVWRNCAAIVLLVLGSFQMLGDITGSRVLRGIGAASAMSPAPKVFNDVDGLETFASEFTLHYRRIDGQHASLGITPEVYGRLGGPYNRRNVYGAALSYAPRLPEPLWTTVFCYGLTPGGPLRSEIGIPADAHELSISIRTLTRGRTDQWTYAPICAPSPR
jgi:hypothetical protein